MKVMKLALLCAVFVATIGAAVSPQEAVVSRDREWNEAIRARDVAAARSFMTDDFELIGTGGSYDAIAVPLASWLETLKVYVISEMTVGKPVVRLYGDVAVISYGYHQTALVRGVDRSGDFYILDVWQRRGDQWYVSARHSSRAGLPAAPTRR